MLIDFGTVMDVWSPENPPRVMHCGAHLAEERDAYEAAGAEAVWWVEGNPALLAPLQENLCWPRPIHHTAHFVVCALLGPVHDEVLTLNIAEDTMQSSILPPGVQPVEYVREQTATAMTIDSLCEALGGVQPTMVNLDLQGAELAVLKGATDTLGGVELVYTEVSEVETYAGVPHWSEIDSLLRAAGFRLAKIEMSRNGERWGDALWLRVGCG